MAMEMSSSNTCKRSGSNEGFPENSPKKAKLEMDDECQQEESHILRLLKLLLDNIIALKNVPEESIRGCIQSLIYSFRTKPFTFLDINLSNWEDSCAYLFRYGSHGAGLTRCRLLEALQNCEDFASNIKKPDLKIISLGGGPGNDAVGLCSALYKYEVEGSLTIKVIDSVPEWSSYINLLKVLIPEGNYGNVSKLFQTKNVNFSFTQAKLPSVPKLDKEYFQTLKEADVVLLTKFLSILENSDKKAIVKSLYENMKRGSFIVFIDSPFLDELWNDFELLYLSESGEEHNYISSAKAERRFESYDNVSSKALVAVLRKK